MADAKQVIIGVDRPMQRYLTNNGHLNYILNPPLAQAIIEPKDKEKDK